MSEPAPAHRVSWFAPERPVEGTVYVKPPADGQVRADAQYARPAAELGDPALDPPLVVRVHPDDDPAAPDARRVILADTPRPWPWLQVTGGYPARFSSDEVADWPVQHPIRYCATFRHAATTCTRPAAVLDGADAEGRVPFKEAR